MKYAWRYAAALSVLALAACGEQAQQDTDNAVNATENAFSNAANATGNALEDASLALTPTPSPQEFADKAAKSDAFEIAAGELAKASGSTAAVREFGQTMIDAHTKSTASIKKAASAAMPVITPDATLTSDQKDDLADMGKLKGVEFDKAYINGQVEAHEDALSLMKKYAADGTAPTLQAAAGEIPCPYPRPVSGARRFRHGQRL